MTVSVGEARADYKTTGSSSLEDNTVTVKAQVTWDPGDHTIQWVEFEIEDFNYTPPKKTSFPIDSSEWIRPAPRTIEIDTDEDTKYLSEGQYTFRILYYKSEGDYFSVAHSECGTITVP